MVEYFDSIHPKVQIRRSLVSGWFMIISELCTRWISVL